MNTVTVTANVRLARQLRTQSDAAQLAAHLTSWPTQPVLPWRAWIEQLWLSLDQEGPALLSDTAERFLWRLILEDSGAARELLDLDATAGAAAAAWRRMHAWRIPWNETLFAQHEDSAAFWQWAQAFRAALDDRQLLDASRLPDHLVRHRLPLPSHLRIAGFAEYTPQQTAFFDFLEQVGVTVEHLPLPRFSPRVTTYRFASLEAEMRGAAQWARRQVEAGQSRIGVFIQPLTRVRTAAQRIFSEALHPEWWTQPSVHFTPAFHVAAGQPLLETPAVHTALALLDLSTGGLLLPDLGSLLRSPFLGSAPLERQHRAALDAKLREKHPTFVSLATLDTHARLLAPLLAQLLARAERLRRSVAVTALPSQWSTWASRWLKAWEWPGPQSLTSAEYQAVAAWDGLLSSFATLDAILGPLSWPQAVHHLRELALGTPFQVENENQPVQVLTPTEALGSEFDAVWWLGLTDDAWPAPASPNPFIPLALQRAGQTPHCHAARSLAAATALSQHLLQSAPDVVLSFAERDEERELRPSPLFAWNEPESVAPLPWLDGPEPAPLESLLDSQAPALTETVKGGTTAVKLQSQCPFRAFAEIRLGARSLESGELGLNPRDRGSLVHRVLETLWANLRSHARLKELPAADLDILVRDAIRHALQKFPPQDAFDAEHLDLERERLERLIAEWLPVERQRQPFDVIGQEYQRTITLAGLQITARIDRIDRLADGRHVILDYKTGQADPKSWAGARPSEPQVPLYALSHAQPLAAAAFATVRSGSAAFAGLAAHAGILPDVEADDLPARLEEWRRVITALAEEFVRGEARVDPQPGACQFCPLTSFCRIKERIAPGEDG
jgi:probable DNA repair protein